MLDRNLIFWPLYLLVFFLPTLIFIPRKEYKMYLLYGLIFGGMIDALTILVIGNLWGQFRYIAGPLTALNIPIIAPLVFTFVWMLFLYFLPRRKSFLILYILGWTGFSTLIGPVLQNLGFFQINGGLTKAITIHVVTFLAWFTFSAWYFLRDQRLHKNTIR